MNEGKNLLIEEFGREYGTYFSILELISVGKSARSEIESILERQVGGYLERLEDHYAIISKHKPIHAKPNSRMQKYGITDNFLSFWFRFIYRHRSKKIGLAPRQLAPRHQRHQRPKRGNIGKRRKLGSREKIEVKKTIKTILIKSFWSPEQAGSRCFRPIKESFYVFLFSPMTSV